VSENWERAAQALLDERGLSDRVSRVVGDFIDEAEGLPMADVGILHRVVCCY
jgi:hypothetical protein